MNRVALAIAVTVVLWSSAFPAIRKGVEGYSAGHLALLRFLTASAFLGLWAVRSPLRWPSARDLGAFFVLGATGLGMYNVALNFGETTVPAGAASFLICLSPMFTALLGVLALGERLGLYGWLGVGVCLTGVALMAADKGLATPWGAAVLAIVLAALVQGFYFAFQKPLLRRCSAREFTSYATWSATVVLLVFLPGLWQAVRSAPVGSTLAAVHLGLFPGSLAFVAWAYVVARRPVSNAAGYVYLVPVLATGMAWLWLGEVPTLRTLVGGAVTLAGVAVVGRYGRPARAPIVPATQPAEE